MPLALCFSLLLAPHVFGSQVGTKPSLDTLVERVNAYWSLLLAGKKLEALELVDRESRENFLSREVPVFSEPRLSSLAPDGNGTEVSVTVTVKRPLTGIPVPMEWPVREKWAFREGKWFVTIARSRSPFFSEPKGDVPSLSAEEVERRKKAIRNVLQVQSALLDFGTVRQGERAPLALKYRLDGDHALDVRFEKAPPDLIVQGLEERKIVPGKSQAIVMELLTQNYDGKVDETFTVVVRHQEVEVPYEFKVQGFVYTPVSVFPRVLRFRKDEREHEIVVRNNSKSEVKVSSIYSQSRAFKIEPLPQALAPGAEHRFKIILVAGISETNYRDLLALIFAQPVEGMANLSLPVVLNYVERKKKTFEDLTPGDIEKLMRQSKPQ